MSETTTTQASASPNEEDLKVAAEALRRVARSERKTFEVAMVLEELDSWIADADRSTNLFAGHWRSLIDDLAEALQRAGPRLRPALDGDASDLLDELAACRRALGAQREPPDPSLRRRIQRAAERVESAAAAPAAQIAAFDDVLEAASPKEREAAVRRLLSLAEQAGQDPTWFPSRLAQLLGDDAHIIALVRGDELPDDSLEQAGTTPTERVDVAREMLRQQAPIRDMTVWLSFAMAKLRWPPVLKLGDGVTLFQDDWLISVLSHGQAGALAEYAAEAAGDRVAEIKMFAGVPLRAEDRDGEEEGADDHVPRVYLRVEVKGLSGPHALAAAKQTADVISGLVTLHGSSPRLWVLDSSHLLLADSHFGGAAYGSPPVASPSGDDRIALSEDNGPETLAEAADSLGPHLPVRDSRIAEAATLLSWLRQAKAADSAPRLLLCDRVLEQVAQWAGFSDPKRFIADHLRPGWTYQEVRHEVFRAAHLASSGLAHQGEVSLRETFTKDVSSGSGIGMQVDLKAFLEQLDEIEAALTWNPGLEAIAQLRATSDRPAQTTRWIRSIERDFDRQEARRRRTRNALVHGGPMVAPTIECIVEFAEQVAVSALALAIEARLAGEDAVDFFLDRQDNLARFRQKAASEPLSVALFWDA